MEPKKSPQYSHELFDLYDEFAHGEITRRQFTERAAKFAIGISAAALLQNLQPNYALAQQVPKDDPRIKSGYVDYPSPKGSGTMHAYLSRPAKPAGKLPGVVVGHEAGGLNPVCRGCGAPPGPSQLHRSGSRRPNPSWRIPRRSGERVGASKAHGPRQDERRFRRRRHLPASRPRMHGKSWHGGFLFWRRRRRPVDDSDAEPGLRGLLLRPRAGNRRRRENQGAPAVALCRVR